MPKVLINTSAKAWHISLSLKGHNPSEEEEITNQWKRSMFTKLGSKITYISFQKEKPNQHSLWDKSNTNSLIGYVQFDAKVSINAMTSIFGMKSYCYRMDGKPTYSRTRRIGERFKWGKLRKRPVREVKYEVKEKDEYNFSTIKGKTKPLTLGDRKTLKKCANGFNQSNLNLSFIRPDLAHIAINCFFSVYISKLKRGEWLLMAIINKKPIIVSKVTDVVDVASRFMRQSRAGQL